MIVIRDSQSGIKCSLIGKLDRQPTKRGYSEVESIRGQVFTEQVRSVVNLMLNVEEMSWDMYFNLEKIFMTPNSVLDIEDTDKGTEYTNYYIKGESFQFEEKENYDTKEYYYAGSLSLAKR
ncbi:MAG: hypothetical protein ACRCZ0_10250 [Cetobacterium sp.]